MRRPVVALMLIAFAVSLVGCGGGAPAEDAAATGGAAGSGAVAAPPAVIAAGPTDPKLSSRETANDEQFPTSTDSVPKEILTRLALKQPMLIYYYDSTQNVTNDQRKEVNAVIHDYRGLIDLVAYDEVKVSGDDTSTVDAEDQKAMTLAGEIGVKHAPYMVFVDRAGRITGRFAGFTDRLLLEREVLRATE